MTGFIEIVVVFKLDVEGGQKPQQKENTCNQRVITRMKNILEETVQHAQHTRALEPRLFLKESETDPRIEFAIQFVASEVTSETLELLMNLYKQLKSIDDKERRVGNAGIHYTIVLPQKDIGRVLKSSFTALHANVPLTAISFCNVIKHNVLVEHKRVNEMRGRLKFVLDNAGAGQRFDGSRVKLVTSPFSPNEIPEHVISAEFQHDQRNLLVTFFNVSQVALKQETDVINPPKSSLVVEVVDEVRLVFRYSSILQIYWDMPQSGFGMRLFFRLVYPPFVYKISDVFKLGPKMGDSNSRNMLCRCRGTWDEDDSVIFECVRDSPVFMLEIASPCDNVTNITEILGRLQDRMKLPIEIRSFVSTHISSHSSTIPLDGLFFDDFDFIYALEAFANACGKVATDHLVDDEVRSNFFERIAELRAEDRELALVALEQFVCELSNRTEVPLGGIQRLFEIKLMDLRQNNSCYMPDLKWFEREGYVFVQRVTLTPTRMIYGAREMIMGNRVLRFDPTNYPVERFLRVSFRDEDFEKVFAGICPPSLIDEFVGRAIRDGIFLGDRHFLFLGSSNSQIRDGGSYFVQIGEPGIPRNNECCKARFKELNDFRERLGQFSSNNIPKMMARLGQCFTQAYESNVVLHSQMLGEDFVGSRDGNGKQHCFSDGCGSLSMAAAKRIAFERRLDVSAPPSCYQFRYSGYKGVLVVNPEQDAAIDYFIKNSVCDCHPVMIHNDLDRGRDFLWGVKPCKHQKALKAVHFYFRQSQRKFELTEAQQAQCKLEIVKFSMPSSVAISRQLVNILDQVSYHQSRETHQRISQRLECLLELHLHDICLMLTDEKVARQKLDTLPRFLDYRLLKAFDVVSEPFFRLMLASIARVAVQRIRLKANICLPVDKARIMFGVIDDTGLLQNGQITKNPCIISGDVRMFEAVDVLALHHFVNVLVFPRWGPCPHAFEMAGSDLDGDEYLVIWDSDLFIHHNEPAFDYSPENSENHMPEATHGDPVDLQQKISDFFVNFMANDSIGRIANSHLANSDLYGLNTIVSKNITRKHSQAVDFQKSGVAPQPLTKKWDEDNPPERFERAPDFMEKDHEPQYISARLNGLLFRQIRSITDCILAVMREERKQFLASGIQLDTLFIVRIPESVRFKDWWTDEKGGQPWEYKAAALYQKYANSVLALMKHYGIECEGELFSCTFFALKNRISGREDDDMSIFNTAAIIKNKFREIVRQARYAFFQHFGGLKAVGIEDDKGLCTAPTDEIKRLATACYLHAYGHQKGSGRLLSFAWVSCYEILNKIRRENIVGMQTHSLSVRSLDVFGDRVTYLIYTFIGHQQRRFEEFLNKFHPDVASKERGQRKDCSLAEYFARHPSLDKLMFFCVEWARKHELLVDGKGPFLAKHICLLLVMHLRLLPCEMLQEETSLLVLKSPNTSLNRTMDIAEETGGIGRKFVNFLRYLASRDFQRVPALDFGPVRSASYFFGGEWLAIHTAASMTYHHLVFSLKGYDMVLPTYSVPLEGNTSTQQNVLEKVFVAEVPTIESVCEQLIPHRLSSETGCDAVCIRANFCRGGMSPWRSRRCKWRGDPNEIPHSFRLLITCWGSHEAIRRLRRIFTICPSLNVDPTNRQQWAQNIPLQIFMRMCDILPDLWNTVQLTNPFSFLKRVQLPEQAQRKRVRITSQGLDFQKLTANERFAE